MGYIICIVPVIICGCICLFSMKIETKKTIKHMEHTVNQVTKEVNSKLK